MVLVERVYDSLIEYESTWAYIGALLFALKVRQCHEIAYELVFGFFIVTYRFACDVSAILLHLEHVIVEESCCLQLVEIARRNCFQFLVGTTDLAKGFPMIDETFYTCLAQTKCLADILCTHDDADLAIGTGLITEGLLPIVVSRHLEPPDLFDIDNIICIYHLVS